MRPYNFKVWACPTTAMQCEWLGERVAAPDVTRAITNVIHNKEDAGWGPNAVFRFPKTGGMDAIWKGVAELLPKDKQRYGAGCAVVAIDAAAKKATLASGDVVEYESLLTTMPLDVTLAAARRPGRGTAAIVVALRRHRHPRQMPARDQMLALLPGGRLPLLPHDCRSELHKGKLSEW